MPGAPTGADLPIIDRPPIDPQTTRLGWIGTGVMGRSMCGHLLRAGYRVTLTTRSRDKAAALLSEGACWATTPRDVAQAADVIFSMVGYPSDVREVTLGPDGALAGSSPGALLIDMTTSQPRLAQEIASCAAERGVAALDAPVSGGDVGARNATLSIMVGGERSVADYAAPLFGLLGSKWVWQGEAGAGQHAKMVNQTLIAGNMVGVCEAMLYAYKAGLNLDTVLESVASGAAGSWSLSNLAPRMIKHDMAPGFFVEHFLKDMAIALEEARRMNLALPGLALAEQLYRALAAQGGARDGTQALVVALGRISGIDWMHRV